MKSLKTLLVALGVISGFAALMLHYFDPARCPAWRLERVEQNRRAAVQIINLSKSIMGSGVIISRGGAILTASHVAYPGDSILAVTFERGKPKYHLAYVGPNDKTSQLALIFTGDILPQPVSLGSHSRVREGDLLYTVGFPGTIRRPMVDAGIVSRRYFFPPGEHRATTLMRISPVPGMSGSPVFNQQGELIGILDALAGQRSVGTFQLWGVISPIDPLGRIVKKWLATAGIPAPTANR